MAHHFVDAANDEDKANRVLSRTRNGRRVSELIPVLGSQPAGDQSQKPGGRLPLLSTSPAMISPASEYHRPLAGTKLYCLLTEARVCK